MSESNSTSANLVVPPGIGNRPVKWMIMWDITGSREREKNQDEVNLPGIFNQFKQLVASNNLSVRATLALFDVSIERIYDNVPLDEIEVPNRFSFPEYRKSTAYYELVGKQINQALESGENVGYMWIIQTDGEDNASGSGYNFEYMMNAVNRAKEAGHYFMWLSDNPEVANVGASLGISNDDPSGQTFNVYTGSGPNNDISASAGLMDASDRVFTFLSSASHDPGSY